MGQAEKLRELPICRVGALSFPFDLCEEQATGEGLLGAALRGAEPAP